ncbi:hypothetical protein NPX13_g10835 [Xylaria arbuscula]|uniref:UV-damage endonuclease n=1 Tax=Xylaria arbuscula TaxID=114810 RepID=A0A9W8TGF1_9PEZI|nr:hypothetical protein NPX13_g10835 [Xylaria arbuscula]
MGAKRKKSAMALMLEEDNLDERSIPGLANTGRRRSGRLQDKDNRGPRPQPLDGLHVTKQAQPGKSKRERHAEIKSDEADVAVTGLQEMEDQFRNECKRQKKAVKESNVQSTVGNDEFNGFMPRVIKGQPETLSAEGESRALNRTSDAEQEDRAAYPEEDPQAETERLREEKDAELVLDDNDYTIIKQEGARPPPVNSEYLPLPWKASILENRHPLQDPSQPAHATKNRPDRDQPADVNRGRRYVENLGLANARDVVKMLRWNDKYGIKFMRLSSEMFPFASHEEYGYKLAPFASEVLAEAGKVAAELGHRLTTHPGQFTQLGSPRKEVVQNAVRDLEYHNEMLSLLKLPEQSNKDAVMIIHMGGVFGDKTATLDRFRENYAKLSDGVKARLVLENDDVSWTVHDLLPVCEELNIPMVLDYHHHNIMFDKDHIREGTKDIMELYPRIKATWDRKGIIQKMHYSEPCSDAVTPRQRRKHRPRVLTLPPCPDTMDLMIEAKDKEQAVFDLMRNFRLPGWDTFNDMIPFERQDENRPQLKAPKKKKKKPRKKQKGEEDDDEEVEDSPDSPEPAPPPPEVPESEVGMGGPDNRVYWPIGMEEWLRPRKREIKKKKAKIDEDDLRMEKVMALE